MPQLVTLLELDSGESVYVAPVDTHLYRAIGQKAAELHPDVDPEQYKVEKPDSISGFISGEKNPDYIEKMTDVYTERNLYLEMMLICLSIADTIDGKDKTLKKYKARLDALRQFATLPEDDWHGVVIGFLVRSRQDRTNIVKAAREVLPISTEEIAHSFRILRPVLQPNTTVGHYHPPEPQSTTGT